jgi:C4-dicarboxylate-specific signal transduction histidine kinase
MPRLDGMDQAAPALGLVTVSRYVADDPENIANNWIGSRRCQRSWRIVARTARQGREEVRVSVQDNGPGLQGEALEKAFQPFHTTKPQGLGMGLCISRSVVEAHGGRL